MLETPHFFKSQQHSSSAHVYKHTTHVHAQHGCRVGYRVGESGYGKDSEVQSSGVSPSKPTTVFQYRSKALCFAVTPGP